MASRTSAPARAIPRSPSTARTARTPRRRPPPTVRRRPQATRTPGSPRRAPARAGNPRSGARPGRCRDCSAAIGRAAPRHLAGDRPPARCGCARASAAEPATSIRPTVVTASAWRWSRARRRWWPPPGSAWMAGSSRGPPWSRRRSSGALDWLTPLILLGLAWRYLRHPDDNATTGRLVIGAAAVLVGSHRPVASGHRIGRPRATAPRPWQPGGGVVGWLATAPIVAAVGPIVDRARAGACCSSSASSSSRPRRSPRFGRRAATCGRWIAGIRRRRGPWQPPTGPMPRSDDDHESCAVRMRG